jgi:hypothetical protein
MLEKYGPYFWSLSLFFGIISSWLYYGFLPNSSNIEQLANIMITIISIFMSFLWVWLTLLHQSNWNTNVEMLKKNNKYNLFLSYFKQSLLFSFLTIIYSIFISLGICINVYTFWLLLSLLWLIITLNYRIIYFLFKVLEN